MVGPTKLVASGGFSLGKFLLRYWWIIATLIIFIPLLITSINKGIEEEDMRIPLKTMGTILISSDQAIYDVVQDLEFEFQEKESLIEKIDYYFGFSWYLIKNLWQPLWMFLFSFVLFYKIFLFVLGNASKKLRAVIISISTIAFLQLLVFGIPFRGFYNLIRFVASVMGI